MFIGCEENSLADMPGTAGGYLIASCCINNFAMLFGGVRSEFVGKQSGQILSLDNGQRLFLSIHLQSARGGRLDVQDG